MSSKLKQFLQYGLSFVLGLVILYYVFRNEDIDQIWQDIRNAHYGWIGLTYVISMAAHYIRAYRWNLLIKQTGQTVSTGEAYLALLAGYGANLVLPRMGELTRCVLLKKRQGVSFDTTLGTVVAERLFDFICLLFIMLATVVWQHELLFNFIKTLLSGMLSKQENLMRFLYLAMLCSGLGIGLIFLLRKKLLALYHRSQAGFMLKIRSFIRGLAEGIYSIYRMPDKISFLTSTFLIWLCYFFMAYLIFFALPATSLLTMGAGMSILVMGAFGIAAPVQGGIGAYHWIVSQTLLLYGISESDGKTYATLAHASQMILTILFSLVSYGIIILTAPKPDDRT
jgi:glycosyltransferase 2 family protein